MTSLINALAILLRKRGVLAAAVESKFVYKPVYATRSFGHCYVLVSVVTLLKSHQSSCPWPCFSHLLNTFDAAREYSSMGTGWFIIIALNTPGWALRTNFYIHFKTVAVVLEINNLKPPVYGVVSRSKIIFVYSSWTCSAKEIICSSKTAPETDL